MKFILSPILADLLIEIFETVASNNLPCDVSFWKVPSMIGLDVSPFIKSTHTTWPTLKLGENPGYLNTIE